MTMKQISINLEIGLLNVLIDLLSDSRVFQTLVRWTYQVGIPQLMDIQDAFAARLALRWSLAGLISGVLVGLLLSWL
jgi:hypothetical protein